MSRVMFVGEEEKNVGLFLSHIVLGCKGVEVVGRKDKRLPDVHIATLGAALRATGFQASAQPASGVHRVDDRINFEDLGNGYTFAARVHTAHQFVKQGFSSLWRRGCLEFFSET